MGELHRGPAYASTNRVEGNRGARQVAGAPLVGRIGLRVFWPKSREAAEGLTGSEPRPRNVNFV